MKYTTIKNIFHCGISDNDASSELYKQLLTDFSNIQTEIAKLLPEDKQKLIFELSESASAMEAEVAERLFVAGFNLGLKLGAETFTE